MSGPAKGSAVHFETSVIPAPAATSAQAIDELGVSATTRGATLAAEKASSIWWRT